jgi:PadR family transcriptional regulator PadR
VDRAKWPGDWLRGALELCVLSVLLAGPAYGYAIAQRLEAAGLGTVKGGTLYPLLGRLEAEGLIVSSWQTGTSGPARKYFELTLPGRAELAVRSELWNSFATRVSQLIANPQEARK